MPYSQTSVRRFELSTILECLADYLSGLQSFFFSFIAQESKVQNKANFLHTFPAAPYSEKWWLWFDERAFFLSYLSH